MNNFSYVFIGIIVVLLGLVVFEHHEISSLQAKITTDSTTIYSLTTANQQFSIAAKACTDSVSQLKVQSDILKAQAQNAIIAQEAKLQVVQKVLPVIKPTEDSCKDMKSYVDQYYRSIN